MPDLTHLDSAGHVHMVDVSAKAVTTRQATAVAHVELGADLLQRVLGGDLPKGDVLAVVRIAAIQAAKKCSELIPLCHPLPLEKVSVDIVAESDSQLAIRVTCVTSGRTGVEMEAMTAASVGALTLYDMCKSVSKGIQISNIQLLQKSGGKSGDWSAKEAS